MPGAPLLFVSDSYQGVTGEGIPAQAHSGGATASMTGTGLGVGFWVWLVVIGVVIPAVILGGLKAGGFQFVFRRR
jgi:hypothetical protein